MRRLVALVLLSACSARVPRASIEVKGREAAGRPVELEASEPLEPLWISAPESIAGRSFVGRGEAPTAELARTEAHTDMLLGLSMFVAVDVTAAHESKESSNGDQRITDSVETRSALGLEGLAVEREYWSKRLASPFFPSRAAYRYFLGVSLDRAELAALMQKRQAARREHSGTRSVAVLPFSALAPDGDDIGAALAEELGLRLALPGLRILPSDVVRAALPADEDAALSAVRAALLPDVVVRGAYQRHAGAVKLSAVAYDGVTGKVLGVTSAQRPYVDLMVVEDELAGALRSRLGDPARPASGGAGPAASGGPAAPASPDPGAPRGPAAPDLEAFAAYSGAYAAMARGDHDAAMELGKRAVSLAPAEPRAYLRLGRIFERAGRFGRVAPRAAAAAARDTELPVCVAGADEAVGEAKAALAERARVASAPEPTPDDWLGPEILDLDGVLALALVDAFLERTEWHEINRARWQIDPRSSASPPKIFSTPALPGSAVEAYWAAGRAAAARGDRALAADAYLALGGAALRVDRLDAAMRFFGVVQDESLWRGDQHRESLAWLGIGTVWRKKGRLPEARASLEQALALRLGLGEKPYLLEIYNELGALALDAGDLTEARENLTKALHLATQLGNDYVSAVVSNNLGVLELKSGEGARAAERFADAERHLASLGAADEGAAAGLNLDVIKMMAGDLDGAEVLLAGVEKTLAASHQEGRLAQLEAQKGLLELSRGRGSPSLRALAESLLLFRGLGSAVAAQRQANSWLAAQYHAGEPGRRERECLKRAYLAMGAPVFQSEPRKRQVQTVEDIPPGTLRPHDLAVALNAASVLGLSSWRPLEVTYDTLPPVPEAHEVSRSLDGTGDVLQAVVAALEDLSADIRGQPVWYQGDTPGLYEVARRLQQTAQAVLVALAARKQSAAALEELSRAYQEIQGLLGRQLSRWNYYSDHMPLSDLAWSTIEPEYPITGMGEIEDLQLMDLLEVTTSSASGGGRSHPAPPPPPIAYAKPAEYERTLGAATVDPELLIYLDPRACETTLARMRSVDARESQARVAMKMLTALVPHTEKLGYAPYSAALHLNRAALLWFDAHEGDQAHSELMAAMDTFADLGDVRGLAYGYEWLGYFMQSSGAEAPAAEAYGAALKLYRQLGDERGVNRVLDYGS